MTWKPLFCPPATQSAVHNAVSGTYAEKKVEENDPLFPPPYPAHTLRKKLGPTSFPFPPLPPLIPPGCPKSASPPPPPSLVLGPAPRPLLPTIYIIHTQRSAPKTAANPKTRNPFPISAGMINGA